MGASSQRASASSSRLSTSPQPREAWPSGTSRSILSSERTRPSRALAARMRLEPRGDERHHPSSSCTYVVLPAGATTAEQRPRRCSHELAAIAREFGHEARFTSDPALVDWIVALNADTLFEDLREDDRRAEIAAWTHFSDRRAERAGDGFSPTCLGFAGPLVRLLFR